VLIWFPRPRRSSGSHQPIGVVAPKHAISAARVASPPPVVRQGGRPSGCRLPTHRMTRSGDACARPGPQAPRLKPRGATSKRTPQVLPTAHRSRITRPAQQVRGAVDTRGVTPQMLASFRCLANAGRALGKDSRCAKTSGGFRKPGPGSSSGETGGRRFPGRFRALPSQSLSSRRLPGLGVEASLLAPPPRAPGATITVPLGNPGHLGDCLVGQSLQAPAGTSPPGTRPPRRPEFRSRTELGPGRSDSGCSRASGSEASGPPRMELPRLNSEHARPPEPPRGTAVEARVAHDAQPATRAPSRPRGKAIEVVDDRQAGETAFPHALPPDLVRDRETGRRAQVCKPGRRGVGGRETHSSESLPALSGERRGRAHRLPLSSRGGQVECLCPGEDSSMAPIYSGTPQPFRAGLK